MTDKRNNGKRVMKPDLELLTHKYSDHYSGYYWYDTREIDYPVYRIAVQYAVTKEREIHPIIISVLKIISFLETVRDTDSYSYLQKITQLDKDILDNILSEITTKGYLKQGELQLSKNGHEILETEKELITENISGYLNLDGIFGTVLNDREKITQCKREGAIEFKPDIKSRPRTDCLDNEFTGNKTLRQVLIENLKSRDYDITDILQLDTQKLFKRYVCLFYKDEEGNERFLALDKDNEIDYEATELFDRLKNDEKFEDVIAPNKNSEELWGQNVDKFREATSEVVAEKTKPVEQLAITDGKTIEVEDHKKYFIYVLENAKKAIYIQSPWIKWAALEKYEKYIEEALKRGVKITVKYGMKPRSKNDKKCIDEKSLNFFKSLKSLDKNNFSWRNTNDNSKIVICDDDFMITGSFNWLSFGGEDRGETSTIKKNKEEIKKQIEKFNQTDSRYFF